MFKFKKSKGGKTGTLNIEAELTIQHANGLRNSLISSIGSVDHVMLNLEGLTEIDLTCLQLLFSASRTAANTKKNISVNKCSGVFKQAVMDSGFSFVNECILECKEDNCFSMKGDK